MLTAIAPFIPILAGLAAAGLIGTVWFFTARGQPGELPDPGSAKPLGPGESPVPGDLPPASAVVEGLIGGYDDAAFHETRSGDSINALVTRTLNKISPGSGNVPAMIGGLRRLLNRSSYNRQYYGEPMPSDNYAFNGVAVNRAFMPKHEDAAAILRTGFLPKRNIDANGKRIGPSTQWGDPWVPALNHNAVRNGVSDPDLMLAPPWPDGTPATEPPPELFEALSVRPA